MNAPLAPLPPPDDAARRQRMRAVAPWLAHPQAIRAVCFDVGFTLLREHPDTLAMIAAVCARAGVAVTVADLAARYPLAERRFAASEHVQRRTWADNAAIDAAWIDYFTVLVQPFFAHDRAALQRVVVAILRAFDEHTAWQPYDDVVPTLTALRGHYTLGAVSDWGVGLGAILRELGLSDYLDVLVVSATTRRAKPDPQLFELALQRGDALGDYTLFVGDTYISDVLGARAAGMHPILLDRAGRHDPLAIDCPVIRTLAEIPALLAGEA